jgi:hypothetical protein
MDEQAIVAAENLAHCRQVIEEYFGAEIPVSHLDPDGACAIARACNWYAKHTGDYGPKVLAFAAASCLPGVEGGWDRDGCFRIRGPVSDRWAIAHDPFGDLYNALCELDSPLRDCRIDEEWDGRRLQPWSVEVLAGLPVTRDRVVKRVMQ